MSYNDGGARPMRVLSKLCSESGAHKMDLEPCTCAQLRIIRRVGIMESDTTAFVHKSTFYQEQKE
jgi:hypothetical protein